MQKEAFGRAIARGVGGLASGVGRAASSVGKFADNVAATSGAGKLQPTPSFPGAAKNLAQPGGGAGVATDRNLIRQMQRRAQDADTAAGGIGNAYGIGKGRLDWRDMEMYSPMSGESVGPAHGYIKNTLNMVRDAKSLPRGSEGRADAASMLNYVRQSASGHPRSYHTPLDRYGRPATPTVPTP